jgi:hypothetical protein
MALLPTDPGPPADAPRFAAWRALGVYLACALLVGFPALAGQFLVSPISDQYIAGHAFREFATQVLSEQGRFPLWNPYLFNGMPYVAAMHGDIFYPTFLLRLALGTDAGMTWGMILHLVLAGWATYGFLRVSGLGFGAALVGGVAYMLSGQVASLVSPGHDGKLFVSALFPVTLMVLRAGVRGGRAWAWGGLAGIVGLGVLSPHPQLLQYLLVFAGLYAAWMAFLEGGDGAPTAGKGAARLGLALAAVGVGFCIGAVQYLPVMEYVDWSPRAGGRDYAYATSFSMPVEELLFNTWLPQFTGILDRYWGRNGIHFHSEYLGAAVLFLVPAAFAAAGPARRAVWFWSAAAVVSALWALGGHTPFYQLVYAVVPGTKFFRAPSIIFFVTAFSTAVLAAHGAARLLAGGISRRYVTVTAVVAGVLALAGASGMLVDLFGAFARDQVGELQAANRGAVALGAVRSLGFVLLTAGVAFAAQTRRLPTGTLAYVVTAVVALDLWSIARLYWRFSPPAAELYAADEAVKVVQADPRRGKVLPLQTREGAAYHDPFLFGDAWMVHRVAITRGYHGNELGRYQQLGDKDQGYGQLANPAVWALTNTRWLYTDLDSVPVPGARRAVGPIRNAAGSTVYLHELPGDQAVAWVVPVMMKVPDDVARDAVRQPGFPVRGVALFDTSAAIEGQRPDSAPPPLDLPVEWVDGDEHRMRFRLDAPAPAGSALLVANNFYPGWTATVDGQPAPVYRADYVITGVPLPAGAREVTLTFASAPFERGKAVTLAALALALVAAAVGVVVDRRGAVGG